MSLFRWPKKALWEAASLLLVVSVFAACFPSSAFARVSPTTVPASTSSTVPVSSTSAVASSTAGVTGGNPYHYVGNDPLNYVHPSGMGRVCDGGTGGFSAGVRQWGCENPMAETAVGMVPYVGCAYSLAKSEGLDIVMDCVPGWFTRAKSAFKFVRNLKRLRAEARALPGLQAARAEFVEAWIKKSRLLSSVTDEARIAAETERVIAGHADEAADGSKWLGGKAAEDAASIQNVTEAAGEKAAKEVGETTAGKAAKPGESCFLSFGSETRVLMADGSTKAISQVRVGDFVLAQDPETGVVGARAVSHLWIHVDDLVRLEIDGAVVRTTEDHPFWNDTDREWQRADQLDMGDLVLTAEGRRLPVGALIGSAGRDLAYNFTVEGMHTYHVLFGQDAVVVHNCENFGISEEAENIAKHANENAFRPGTGINHNIPGVDPKALDAYVDGVLDGYVKTEVKYGLRNGRTAYWDASKGAVIIEDPLNGGTVFVPDDGYSYFKGLR
jgi:hypothetical protein